jgi:hypothetical protein
MKTRFTLFQTRWVAAVAMLGILLCTTAVAASPEQSAFTGLQGVNAQTLSVNEMQKISGELNAYDIAADLVAQAAKLAKFPKLQADTLKLAAWTLTNADAINAGFAKLHILTPCHSSSAGCK